ncbi:UNVERIFIED_CONTAM: hypothetical protein NCL1_36258 [Trichonephila clavipes]
MALLGRAVTSRTLSQELGSLTRQQVSARSVRRRMQHHELSWRDVIFSDELSFGFQHQDGCIRVWRYHGDCTLAGCIHHRHTYRSPSEMVWGAIGYTSRSPLVRINGTLNSARYISGGLRLTILDTENDGLLPSPVRSPDISPTENVLSMVAERLARHHMRVTTVDEVWYRAEAAWAFSCFVYPCPGTSLRSFVVFSSRTGNFISRNSKMSKLFLNLKLLLCVL